MEIQKFCIYNLKGNSIKFTSIDEMVQEIKNNPSVIADSGYSAISIDYVLNGASLPGSIDVITRYDECKFSISSDVNSSDKRYLFNHNKFCSSVDEIKKLIPILNGN